MIALDRERWKESEGDWILWRTEIFGGQGNTKKTKLTAIIMKSNFLIFSSNFSFDPESFGGAIFFKYKIIRAECIRIKI